MYKTIASIITAILLLMAAPITLSQQSAVKSGVFTICNHTNRYVVVKVGDFWPTPYYLAPYDSTVVYVSTDNQNIIIDSIH